MNKIDRWLIAALILVITFMSRALDAQQVAGPKRPTRVAATIVLVDSLAAGTPFRILRRASATPNDVILLSAGADTSALSAALEELLSMRRAQGDTAQTTGMMRVRHPQGTSGQRPHKFPWVTRVLNDLHMAPRRIISGVGTVRAVEIWLPPQRRRLPPR